MYELAFERCEEALDHSVVVAVTYDELASESVKEAASE